VNDDATARRRQLGRLLRKARKSTGLTQAAVAAQLGCGQAKINKIETTLVSICPTDIDKLVEVYGTPEAEAAELRVLAALDQQEGPPRTQGTANAAFTVLTEQEADATEICCWHGERFPGPLQSESYLLELHRPMIASTADVLRYMLLRADRVRVFTVENAPVYRAVLSEAAFSRIPARLADTILVDQATYLLELLDTHEKADLRILPFGAEVPYVDTDFEILRFTGKEQRDFAYIEYPSGSKKFTKPDDLREFQEHWDVINAAALTRAQTHDFLTRLAKGCIPPPTGRVP
jgi:transcriptional regulator with XRE-family HTH domain